MTLTFSLIIALSSCHFSTFFRLNFSFNPVEIKSTSYPSLCLVIDKITQKPQQHIFNLLMYSILRRGLLHQHCKCEQRAEKSC